MPMFDSSFELLIKSIAENAARLMRIVEKSENDFFKPHNVPSPQLPSAIDISFSELPHILILLAETLENTVSNVRNVEALIPAGIKASVISQVEIINQSTDNLAKAFEDIMGEDLSEPIQRIEGPSVQFANGTTLNLSSYFDPLGQTLEQLRHNLLLLHSFREGEGSDLLSKSIDEYLHRAQNNEQLLKNLRRNQKQSKTLINSLESHVSNLDAITKTVNEHSTSAQASRSQAESSRAAIEEAQKQVASILNEAQTLQESIKAEQSRLDTFVQTVDSRDKTIKESELKIKAMVEFLQEQKATLERLTEESRKLLTGATSSALGESFAREAKKRLTAVRLSALILGFSLIWMFGILIWLFTTIGSPGALTIDALPGTLLKLAGLIPAVIAAQVSARNLAINRLMREEYSHKAALSTALEGYRSLVDEEKEADMIMGTMAGLQVNPAARLDHSAVEANVGATFKRWLPSNWRGSS